jgi:hypothetical protein
VERKVSTKYRGEKKKILRAGKSGVTLFLSTTKGEKLNGRRQLPVVPRVTPLKKGDTKSVTT